MRLRRTVLVVLSILGFSLAASSQSGSRPADVRPTTRVLGRVDPESRVRLSGNRHPWAQDENIVGDLSADQPLEHIVLLLRPDPAQEDALQELIQTQQDPESPSYHQWLTPETFGERFGISENDLTQVVNWLQSQGLHVDEIPASHRAVVFSGAAGQVETAFHTSMRRYSVNGQIHFANAADLEIPRALGEVVQGVVSLHDFRSIPAHAGVAPAYSPAYTLSNGVNLLMPLDWATVYDVVPLYSQGLDGRGQSIAVVARTDIDLTDVHTFRTNAGLPANDPQKMFVNGVNPGMPDCEDEAESALDVEWAGALAKNATVKFVSAKSGATDGVILASQYAVNNNVAPIVTVSYLHCENTLSDGGRSLWGSLWSQAAAQGQSVFVASGDSGAAGCDTAIAKTATQGKAVNAICSSPNSTCVGGTQFNEGYNPNHYWTAANGTGLSSALSYIPEVAWNETSWSGMINTSSGGGVSTAYSRPAWQSAPGVPAGTMRNVPDIAASSAIHDAYVIQVQGKAFYIAGTSAASPSLASVAALILQNAGGPLGNLNPALYTLATQQTAGGPAVFHDVTSGNNGVPGVTGFNAGAGYDMVTGLGSPDAFLLVNSWSNSRASNFTLAINASSLTVLPGASKTATLTLSVQGGFTAPVTLSAVGAPAGIAVTFSSPTLTAAAPVTMTVTAAANTATGTHAITVAATGGGFTRTVTVNLTVSSPPFTLLTSATSAMVAPGSSVAVILTASSTSLTAAPVFSVRGLPTGVTATFSQPILALRGTYQNTLTLSASAAAASAVSSLTIAAVAAGVTQTQTLSLTVVAATFTLTPSATSVSLVQGGSIPLTLATAAGVGFKSAIALSVSGLPKGVTASLAPAIIPSPGTGRSTLTLTAAPTAATGTATLTLTANGGGVTKTQTFSLSISTPSSRNFRLR